MNSEFFFSYTSCYTKVKEPSLPYCLLIAGFILFPRESDIFLWTPSHRQAKVGRPARTYIQQLCADTGCSLEDLPGAMDDREGWWEKVREIRAGGATWWWWWWLALCEMQTTSFRIWTWVAVSISMSITITITTGISNFCYIYNFSNKSWHMWKQICKFLGTNMPCAWRYLFRCK